MPFEVEHHGNCAFVTTRPQAAAFVLGPSGNSIKQVRVVIRGRELIGGAPPRHPRRPAYRVHRVSPVLTIGASQVSVASGARTVTALNGGKKGRAHVFQVTGSDGAVKAALEYLRAAILLHTALMWALAAGKRVAKDHRIGEVPFTFLAPGRHAAMRYVHSVTGSTTGACEPPSTLRVREIEKIIEEPDDSPPSTPGTCASSMEACPRLPPELAGEGDEGVLSSSPSSSFSDDSEASHLSHHLFGFNFHRSIWQPSSLPS